MKNEAAYGEVGRATDIRTLAEENAPQRAQGEGVMLKYAIATMYAVFAFSIVQHGAYGLAVAYFIFGCTHSVLSLDNIVNKLWIAGNKQMIPMVKTARFVGFVGVWTTLGLYDVIMWRQFDAGSDAFNCIAIAIGLVVFGPMEYRLYRQ